MAGHAWWKMARARRAAGAVLVAVALSGCTVLMTEPARPGWDKFKDGMSFDEAMKYVENARTRMQASIQELDQYEQATRGMVGVGVGGAAVATLGKASADPVLAFLAMGGAGYSINQTSLFLLQSSIYDAGLGALSCIERTGYQVHRETGKARTNLQARSADLARASAALAAELASARVQTPNAMLTEFIAQSETALGAAARLQTAIRDFLNTTDAAFAMYAGVDETVRVVKAQVRTRTPKIDDIAKAGSILTDFVAAQSRVSSQANSTNNAAATKAVSMAANSPVARLVDALATLRKVAGEIQAELPAAGYATSADVATCQSLLPGKGVFRLMTEGPVTLKAGGEAFDLIVESDLPTGYAFNGPSPSAQQLLVSQPGPRRLSLAAPAGAAATKYRLVIYELNGEKMGRKTEMEISITPAPPVVKKDPPAGTTGSVPARPAAALTFEQRRALIGLAAPVASEDDPAWKDRVKKLNNCPGIQLNEPVLGDKLIAALGKRKAVNSQGDCPELKSADTGTAGARTANAAAAAASAASGARAPASAASGARAPASAASRAGTPIPQPPPIGG